MSLDLILQSQTHTPDILDCLAHLSSDEVFTPPLLAEAVLDELPVEVWSDPDLKWLNPASKSGVFLREAAKRLMVGLEEAIPDEDERRSHIFGKMLHGVAITDLTSMISRRTVYYSKDPSNDHSVVQFDNEKGNIDFERREHTYKKNRTGSGSSCVICGGPDSLDRGEGLENYAYQFIHGWEEPMKFDVVIGNPPYQIGNKKETDTSESPIYQLFVERALELDPRYLAFIIPSRWFTSGKGLGPFRTRMLNDRSIKTIVDYPNLFEAFPNQEIKGGVCYFLRDAEHDGDCEFRTFRDGEVVSSMVRDLREGGDSIIRYNEAVSVLRKIQAENELTLEKHVEGTGMLSQTPFGLYTNFSEYSPKPTKTRDLKLYVRGATGWMNRDLLKKKHEWLDKWKVLIAKASDGHGRIPAKVLPVPIVAGPDSACTQTYLVAGVFDTEKEAANFAAYLSTKFFRFMVHLRKITQDNRPALFAFVPVLDMKKQWTDQDLYERYGLSDDEVELIESQITDSEYAPTAAV